ncbi:MAG: O-antigen ligase [Parcubacteria bacterium C7867-006]|nr:MAG: O-antigen ligase [Parcubacteria bacterium C7867-006]
MQTFKNILKYSVLAGLFIIPFIPFIVPQAMFFPFITGKGFAFRIITEIIFGLFVILAFIDSEYRPKMSWITKSVLLFTFIVLVADIFGVNPYKSLWSNYERMEGFVLISHLALFYIVSTSMFNSFSKWVNYLNLNIGASALMSIYGLFQLAGKATINQGGVRVDGTFGNATYLAIYLVFNIFLCLYFLVDSSKAKWQRWVYASIGLLDLIILYYTATRGAILGLIGGLVLVGIITVFKEKENLALRKISYSLLAIILVIVGGFISVRNTDFVQKSPVLSRFSSLGFSEIKNQGRYFVWPMAIKGFKENPVLGWGQENFNFVFNKNYDPRMYGQEQWFDRTHDIFLDWLIAGGLLGLLSYLSLYAALLYYIWRKESQLKLSEKSILTGLVAAYLFHNIFVFDNLISYIMFFSVLGFVHSISVNRNPSLEQSSFYTKRFSDDVVYYVVAPIVIIFTVLGVYFVNIPALIANQTLIQAMTPQSAGITENFNLFKKVYTYDSFGNSEATEQLIQIAYQVNGASGVPDNVKQQFYELAKLKIEEKVAQTPNDARYLVFAGSFYNRFGQYDDAIKYLERAIVESPNKQSIYAELGSSYLGKKDLNKMFENMKRAYDLAPNSKESQIIYALAAIYTKNTAVLSEMSKKIDQQTILTDNRFLQTYAAIGDYNAVISILLTRIQQDPNNKDYKLSLASTYYTMGQKQKAIDVINAMIKEDPSFKEQGDQYIKQINGN